MKEMSRYAVEMENISKIYTLKTKDKAKKKTQFASPFASPPSL